MASFSIDIRRGAFRGELSYKGSIVITTECHWRGKRIPKGIYQNCSAERMTTSGRVGIYIPCVPGASGIFIHQAPIYRHMPARDWSKGCIVVDEYNMQRIWDNIKNNKASVIVRIYDDYVPPTGITRA